MNPVAGAAAAIALTGLVVTGGVPAIADGPRGRPGPVTVRLVDGPTGPNCGSIQDPDIVDDAVVLRYNGFIAYQPGPSSARSSACGLKLEFTYPAGMTFAARKALYKGWVNLRPGVSAVFETMHKFTDTPRASYVRETFTGDVDREWVLTKDAERIVNAPCGGSKVQMIVNMSLSLTGDSSLPGVLSMQYSEHKAETRIHVPLEPC